MNRKTLGNMDREKVKRLADEIAREVLDDYKEELARKKLVNNSNNIPKKNVITDPLGNLKKVEKYYGMSNKLN